MERIEAIAFAMWLGKYSHIQGPEGQWLTYWEHYDIWLTHERREHYIKHATTMNPLDRFKNKK